jgi:superfamily II DNA helicase RecQ
MVVYGQTALCRWAMILKYFGEDDVTEQCGHCDNCTGSAKTASAPAAGISRAS